MPWPLPKAGSIISWSLEVGLIMPAFHCLFRRSRVISSGSGRPRTGRCWPSWRRSLTRGEPISMDAPCAPHLRPTATSFVDGDLIPVDLDLNYQHLLTTSVRIAHRSHTPTRCLCCVLTLSYIALGVAHAPRHHNLTRRPWPAATIGRDTHHADDART